MYGDFNASSAQLLANLLRGYQSAFARVTTQLHSLDGIRRLANQVNEIAAPAQQLAKMLNSFDLKPFQADVSRAYALNSQVLQITEQLRAFSVQIPVRDLSRELKGVAAILESTRTASILPRPSIEILFAGVVKRLEDLPGPAIGDATVNMADVVEASSQELAMLPPQEIMRLSPVSYVGILLTIIFGMLSLYGDQMSKHELGAIRSRLEETAVLQETQLSEISAVIDQLVSETLNSGGAEHRITPSHTLTRSLHLRLGPSTGAGSVGTFPAGTRVEIVSRVDGWANVLLREERTGRLLVGWMYGRYLRADE